MSNKNLKIFILVFALVTAMFSFYAWQVFKTPNFNVKEGEKFELLLPKGSNFKTLMDSLNKYDLVKDQLSFKFLAKLVGVQEKVKPGRYLIYSTSGNWELLRKLRNGRQDAIKVVVNTWRLKEDIAGKLSTFLPFDSTYIYKQLDSAEYVESLGFTKETIPSIFIPNTYEVFWTADFPSFMEKMKKQYNKYWTNERKNKAAALNLSPDQVGVLASIVEGESKKSDEQSRIAGVYWNRLQKNMPLQADPTVVFAWKDFTIKRVTGKYTGINSPYNTYRVVGLPPGPISIPNPDVIDKVLNLEKHDYLYFCAKEDFSGYHSFAVDYASHLKNAAAYQKALDANQIK
jgi:UPF0755 protein